jgi:hypothetical protein
LERGLTAGQTVGVSAVSGAGIDDFFTALDEAAADYERCVPRPVCVCGLFSDRRRFYRPELERRIEQKACARLPSVR